MDPATLALIGLGLYVLFKGQKKKGASPGPRLLVKFDCSGWDLDDGWLETVAQRRWAAFLENQWPNPLNPPETESPDWTRMILNGSLPKNCRLPPDVNVQIDNPTAPNYWDGPEAMLTLFQHIHDFVQDAAERWIRSGGTDNRFVPKGSE